MSDGYFCRDIEKKNINVRENRTDNLEWAIEIEHTGYRTKTRKDNTNWKR
jgi:hypothetical protein